MSKIEVGGYNFLNVLSAGENGSYPQIEFGHMFLRFTNSEGRVSVIRGGFSPFSHGLPIDFEINVPWESSVDNPDNSNGAHDISDYAFREISLPAGQDPEIAWKIMMEAVESIEAAASWYLTLWNNCIAVVQSALNSVGVDHAAYKDAIVNETGGIYPNFAGIINVPYLLGRSVSSVLSDDIIHGYALSDKVWGSLGSDEIYGYSVAGPRGVNESDQIDYSGLSRQLLINVNLSPPRWIEWVLVSCREWSEWGLILLAERRPTGWTAVKDAPLRARRACP